MRLLLRENVDSNQDRSKFKKVNMSVFNGSDQDAWLFCADRYFNIHKLMESQKMIWL